MSDPLWWPDSVAGGFVLAAAAFGVVVAILAFLYCWCMCGSAFRCLTCCDCCCGCFCGLCKSSDADDRDAIDEYEMNSMREDV